MSQPRRLSTGLPERVPVGSPAPRRSSGYSARPLHSSPPPRAPPGATPPRRGSTSTRPTVSPAGSAGSGRMGSSQRPATPQTPLFRTFRQFASFGKGVELQEQMDQQQFVKLCKDTRLVDDRFTAADAGVVFVGVRGMQKRSIGFDGFRKALAAVAQKKGVGATALEERIARVWCPSIGDATYHGVYGGTKCTDTEESIEHVTRTTESERCASEPAPQQEPTPEEVFSNKVTVCGSSDDEEVRRMHDVLKAAGADVAVSSMDAAQMSSPMRRSGFTGGRFALPVVVARGRAWWQGEDSGNFKTDADLLSQLAALGLTTAGAGGGADSRTVVVYGPERCAASLAVREALKAKGVEFKHGDPDSAEADAAIDSSDFPGGRLVLPIVTMGGTAKVWWRTADGKGNWADPDGLAADVAKAAAP